MTGIQDINEEDIWNELDDDGNLIQPGDPQDPEDPADPEEDPEDPADPEEPIDYKALWEKSQADMRSMAGKIKSVEQRAQAAEQAQRAQQPQPPAPPSAEDEFLEKFRAEYSDDVIKAIDIIANRRAAAVADQYYQQRVAPVEQTTLSMVEQQHFGAIEAAHPDVYDIDRDPQFEAWIQSKPAHSRGAYQYVREQGTPAEVISMLNEYKQQMAPRRATNTAPPQEKVNAALAVPRRRGTSPTAAEAAITDEAELWNSIPD